MTNDGNDNGVTPTLTPPEEREPAWDKQVTAELPVNLSLAALVDLALVSMQDEDGWVEFIIAMDQRAGDWNTTLRLADYFDQEREAYEAEHVEDAPDVEVIEEKG